MGAVLDLSGLDEFRPSSLLTREATKGSPMEVALELIDFDPEQPRRRLDQVTLEELAASIKVYGVLEPVSLRPHAERPGRYVVNRGERRVRASGLAGRTSIPAWIDARLDRYAQVIENLQREDLTPFDLARFIAEREREGESRATIARRLNKSRSFVTEVASLVDAPDEVRAAFDEKRIRDVRVLYAMVKDAQRNRGRLDSRLKGGASVTRARLTTGASPKSEDLDAADRIVLATRRADALMVEHGGRRGRLRFAGWVGKRTGEVRFDDGSSRVLELADLKLLAWTTK